MPDLLGEESRLPVGTAVYIAPEEVLRDRSDPRSDIFALGVVLYELATGKQPFGNPSGSRQLRRRLWRDPVPPRLLRADCPPWLQEVILRCMEIDPDARFQTSAQVAFALTHPETVVLTSRAERARRDGLLLALRRRFRRALPQRTESVASRLARAPIILAAVDLTPEGAELAQALRLMVRRAVESEPGARVACVNVLKTSRIAIDLLEDEQGRNLHVQRLLELRHWAHPLDLAPGRITYHVLPAPDAAHELIEYARSNHVDHIIIGARSSSSLRRYIGSVSSEVVAEAPCSVTVVRARVLADVFAGTTE
jgi:nucleotide-binding universal stress UspA family protein